MRGADLSGACNRRLMASCTVMTLPRGVLSEPCTEMASVVGDGSGNRIDVLSIVISWFGVDMTGCLVECTVHG